MQLRPIMQRRSTVQYMPEVWLCGGSITALVALLPEMRECQIVKL